MGPLKGRVAEVFEVIGSLASVASLLRISGVHTIGMVVCEAVA